MKTAIEIKDLSFNYLHGEDKVLKDLSIKIPEGEISLLLGPSGCGKSTIALSLTGIIPNSIEGVLEGEIFFKGEKINGKSPGELSTEIGIVMQDPESQFCTFTVEDEIAFGLENLNYSREEIDRKIDEALSLLGMKEYRYRMLSQLSGGEKQKVAICSILAIGADCIILDEPTANLDPKSTQDIFRLLVYLRDELKKTIIVIEHKLDELMEYVDNIFVFSEESRLDYAGSPEELLLKLSQEKGEDPLWLPELGRLAKRLREKNKDLNYFITHDRAVAELKSNLGNMNLQGDRATEEFMTTMEFMFTKESMPTQEPMSTRESIPSTNSLIQVKNLSFSYNSLDLVINNLDLEIFPGEFVAIAGSNGAGKSTLAKILLGLYKNYTGEILLENRSLSSYKKRELAQKIGLVFQNPEHQFVTSKVYDELAYTLKFYKLDKEVLESRVLEYLEFFKLKHLVDYNPFQLSQGQKRRLSVASMLIGGQKILILDEPTYGQDRKNTESLMEYMRKLNESGVTIIIITHDMGLVAKYCSRIILLNKGGKAFDGKVKDLFQDVEAVTANNLSIPPIPSLSLALRDLEPSFPFLMTIEEYANLVI